MLIEDMRERYIVARWCYLMGEPFLSDIEYDKLEKEFKQQFPLDPYSTRHWPFDECPEELLKKYGLDSLICQTTMGYMAESIYSINNKPEYYQVFRDLNEKSRLSFKIDGWNTRVSYFNGNLVKVESRGRSGNNLDMNNIHCLFPKTIPIKGRVAITGELSIPNRLWDEYKQLTGNSDQRASVRTALARGDAHYLEFLAFNIFIENENDENHNKDPYDLLKELGFSSPRFVWVNDFAELDKYVKYMSYISRGYGYLTDGLVIENSKYQYAIRLGAWEEKAICSYVTGYIENQGMYGVFYNVSCHPIQIEGKSFSKISINNIQNIIDNNLQIGAPIAFAVRSAANVVIDTTETKKLQTIWEGKYEEFQNKVKRGQI